MPDDPFRAHREAEVIDLPSDKCQVTFKLHPLPGCVFGSDCTMQIVFLRAEGPKEAN